MAAPDSTAKSPVRIAILGTGIWAIRFHLPVMLDSAEVEVAGVWGRSEQSRDKALPMLETAGIKLKPKFYIGDSGLSEIWSDKTIEAVLLALPITAQPPLILQALEAGKHVLSEKPVAKDTPSALGLIKRYEEDYEPKGLIWRVAENYAHEPILRRAAEILRQPAIGPVLYWQMTMQLSVSAGSLFHATAWRTVPDYQGGFILDGGVHNAAMLRTILPVPPKSIISKSTLHRSYLPPHDTVTAIALPPGSATTPPHQGPLGDVSAIPVTSGNSFPTGTILMTWAAPDVVKPGTPNFTLEVVCLNGKLILDKDGPLKWRLWVKGTEASGISEMTEEAAGSGLKVETEMFARAIRGGNEPNLAEPRAALWDLELIEALLNSNGSEIELDSPPSMLHQ